MGGEIVETRIGGISVRASMPGEVGGEGGGGGGGGGAERKRVQGGRGRRGNGRWQEGEEQDKGRADA
jgi:hypothetical protein